MLSAGGDRGEEKGRDVDQLTRQFLIVTEKHDIENISRMKDVMVGRHLSIV
jgi:hypothetical protein